jgi:predicted RNA-binding Zn ribbon-like protein
MTSIPPAGTNLGETRDGFRFRGGHPALDLAATLAARLKPEPRELLGGPRDLDRWLAAAGFAKTRSGASPQDLEDARRLREAIYQLAVARINGGVARQEPEHNQRDRRESPGDAAARTQRLV